MSRTRLGDIALFRRGASPRPIADPKWFSDTGPGWVRIADVTRSGKYLTTTEQCLSEEGVSRSVRVKRGDVLISVAASVGVTAIVQMDACIHDGWVAVSDYGSHCDGEFLYYLLNNEAPRISAIGQAGTQANINAEILRDWVVSVPPLATQRYIASILRLTDELLTTIEHLITVKRAFKRALMNDLLTGRRRFPEFVRSSGTRWTRLGTIPTDWEISPLSTVTERLTRRNAANVPRVLTCSGEQGLIDQTEFFSKLVASDAREGYFLLHHGDFAYNRSTMKGYPFGAIKRLDKYEIGAVSTLNICFSLRPSTIDSDFVVHLFESGVLNRQLGRIARVGSRAHGLLNVTMDDFYAIGVPLPSPEEQQTISAVLNRLDDEIALLQDLHISNATLKRGLMQRLLSGEIELPELLPTAGAAAETTDDNS